MEIVEINGRTYTVARVALGPLVEADLLASGWDGGTYLLTGKRGAVRLAARRPSGEYVVTVGGR